MASLGSRIRRTAPVVTCAITVWLVMAWVLDSAEPARSGPPPGARTSIEAPDVLAVIASDRPTTTIEPDQSGHLRVLPGLAETGSVTIARSILVVGGGGFPASLPAIAPRSFGLARRAPPAPSFG